MVFKHDYKRFPELTNQEINDFGFSSPHKQITEDFDAYVTKVIDGDTIKVETDFRDFEFKIRFLEIDTKELGFGGETSKDYVRALIENKKVRILIDKNNRVGKYGRLLGWVLFNGINISNELLRLGYAVPIGTKNQQLPQPIEKILSVKQWF
jgi:endonuclease YncB( thermonuclease family)